MTCHFPVSGVEVALWLPATAAFAVSFFTSMVGVSGAFLLLPFQMSVLHYLAPSVSATNLVYNLIAIPGAVYRYWREGRLLWPLVGVLTLGTLPGVVAGFYLRVYWLADPHRFQMFVSAVLLLLAYRLSRRALAGSAARGREAEAGEAVSARAGGVAEPAPQTPSRPDQPYPTLPALRFPPGPVFALALAVGVVGGAYGIGGGALMAPLLVGVFHLPVHRVSGAALATTFLTSVVGVAVYTLVTGPPGLATAPDWLLGGLLGLGGLAGAYAGTRVQRHVPARLLEGGLALVVLALGTQYLVGALVG